MKVLDTGNRKPNTNKMMKKEPREEKRKVSIRENGKGEIEIVFGNSRVFMRILPSWPRSSGSSNRGLRKFNHILATMIAQVHYLYI